MAFKPIPTGVLFASQAEAEAGTDNTKTTTPLRVTQANEIRLQKTSVGNAKEGFIQTRASTTTITFSPGRWQLWVNNLLRIALTTSNVTKSISTAWAAGSGNGAQIGTWGNGTQFLYCGFNPTTEATDFFASHLATETTSNGFTLRLCGAIVVSEGAISDFKHRKDYWYEPVSVNSNSHNILTTVAYYPILNCPSGIDLVADCIFSCGLPKDNSAYNLSFFSSDLSPNPNSGSSYSGIFNSDINVYFDDTPVNGLWTHIMGMQSIRAKIYTNTAQFGAVQKTDLSSGYLSSIYYPTCRLKAYLIL